MSKFKKIVSMVLVVAMMMCCFGTVSASAAEISETENVTPMASYTLDRAGGNSGSGTLSFNVTTTRWCNAFRFFGRADDGGSYLVDVYIYKTSNGNYETSFTTNINGSYSAYHLVGLPQGTYTVFLSPRSNSFTYTGAGYFYY